MEKHLVKNIVNTSIELIQSFIPTKELELLTVYYSFL